MSVYGIGGVTVPLPRAQEAQRSRVEQERVGTPARPAAAPLRAPATELPGLRDEAVPAEPPVGTDPELWKVLTAEERSFFMRMNSGGPLTYGRSASVSAPQAPPVRGGRLDVRI